MFPPGLTARRRPCPETTGGHISSRAPVPAVGPAPRLSAAQIQRAPGCPAEQPRGPPSLPRPALHTSRRGCVPARLRRVRPRLPRRPPRAVPASACRCAPSRPLRRLRFCWRRQARPSGGAPGLGARRRAPANDWQGLAEELAGAYVRGSVRLGTVGGLQTPALRQCGCLWDPYALFSSRCFSARQGLTCAGSRNQQDVNGVWIEDHPFLQQQGRVV